MKRVFALVCVGAMALTSCVSKKKYAELESQNNKTEGELSEAKMQLAVCLDKQKNDNTQIDYLKSVNYQLLNSVNNMATLSAQESANLERSLESLSEKERQVRNLQDALNKKDSVMYALVSSLKGEFISADDEDIQIEVEKGAVFVSISDKMLFKSGNADLNKDARAILEKVAKVLNNQPDMEVLVEGHTDNKAFKDGAAIKDNWELSVQRAASVVRVLQNDYNVDPARMIAGGRSYYVPVASNDTKEGRAQNRRIKIIILPKLDQFYGMIEEGME
ncbi:MAG: flagellar motor protein MotB [Schleiferiaceae bacterium]|jgi:chemotaxis protein MotB|nr:flagellar motor protein MotB [Schleiferiaceae bacterium]